jgi:hypothetical protein
MNLAPVQVEHAHGHGARRPVPVDADSLACHARHRERATDALQTKRLPSRRISREAWCTPDRCRLVSSPTYQALFRGYHAPFVPSIDDGSCNRAGSRVLRFKRRRRPKRHEALRRPMEGRQGCRDDERRDLATVPCAVPHSTEGRCHCRACSGSSSPDHRPSAGAARRTRSRAGSSDARRQRQPVQASSRSISKRALIARPIRSFGSIRDRASITSPERTITGTRRKALICVRRTQRPLATARR